MELEGNEFETYQKHFAVSMSRIFYSLFNVVSGNCPDMTEKYMTGT